MRGRSMWKSSLCACFFFFQAEDGIRDYKVTGVQTCALPICVVCGVPAFHHVPRSRPCVGRSEEHTSELQSPCNLVCRLLLEKKTTSAKIDAAGTHVQPARPETTQGAMR